MSTVVLLGFVVLAPVAIGVGVYVAQLYNRLVALRRAVERAWSDVDMLLTQRHDGLLNLAETIRAVGGEPAVAIGLAARFAAIEPWLPRSARYQAEQRINVSVARLLNLLAYHPYLRRNDSFGLVRQRFKALDDHLQHARERYNELVILSNARCERFSDRLLAARAGLRPRSLLSAAEDERRGAVAARTGGTDRARTTDPVPGRGRPVRGADMAQLPSVVLSPNSTVVELLA